MIQKQPSRGVFRKRCSENMLQIYRRTPMLKRNFYKVAKKLYSNHTSARVFSCKFAAYFQNTFFKEHLWMAASDDSLFLRYIQKWTLLRMLLRGCNLVLWEAVQWLLLNQRKKNNFPIGLPT